jgi:BASS family bile acid:Na+ symporter
MAGFFIKVIMVSVMFLMLGTGLKITFSEVITVARNLKLVLIGVVSNFVVIPLFVFIGMTYLPLDPLVKVGIMLMAAAPIAPMAPMPFVAMAKGNVPYSVGLMVIIAMLSVFLTPLILTLSFPDSIGGVFLDPLEIIKTLVLVQLIPISAGMFIFQYRKKWASVLVHIVPKIGQIGLLLGVTAILSQQLSYIAELGFIPHLVFITLTVISIAVGDLLMVRHTSELRRALGVTTAIRNVPLAFLIAGSNFPDSIVTPVVLLYSIYTMILSLLYGKFFYKGSKVR